MPVSINMPNKIATNPNFTILLQHHNQTWKHSHQNTIFSLKPTCWPQIRIYPTLRCLSRTACTQPHVPTYDHTHPRSHPPTHLEEGMEARKLSVTSLQALLAQVKEVDEWRVHSEQGIGLTQHHLTYTRTLTPAIQLLLQARLITTTTINNYYQQ